MVTLSVSVRRPVDDRVRFVYHFIGMNGKREMSDLTDERVESLCRMACGHCSELQLAQEVKRRRAAETASKERVRKVVREALHRGEMATVLERLDGALDAIADRVAEQIADPVQISEEDRAALIWLREVVHYSADGVQHGNAARAWRVIDRLLGAAR